MQVHYDEGIANHIGPEPCGATREGCGEASVGDRIGQPLSRESTSIWVPTRFCWWKAIRTGAPLQAPGRPGAVGDPGMCGRSSHGNREVSRLARAACRSWSASGRRGAEADDARTREVGPRHSSEEAGEQSSALRYGAIRERARCSGVGGAKGGDQGECRPAKHAPDTEPGERVTGAGTHTAGGKQLAPPSIPEVGAGCGKAARPDLCGGRAMKRTSLPLHRRPREPSLGAAAQPAPPRPHCNAQKASPLT